MINLTLPSGSIKQFPSKICAYDVAKAISISLAKTALAAKVDGKLVDLNTEIFEDASIEIITPNMPEGLEIIRHDAAHILAHAIKNLYPTAQITIGPVIEDGFFYDISSDHTFTPDDLVKIEENMRSIIKQNLPINRQIYSREDAIKFFENIGEIYKTEIIKDLPENEVITLYSQGDFTDLCRGPHAPSTKYVPAFKLLKLAGAYWRGDSKNPMLQRIYGTAWASKEDLDAYINRLFEAEQRDHRKIGKELDLFHLQEEASGMVFWHEKGFVLYKIIQEYIRKKVLKNNYKEIKTPVVVDLTLWEKSGHWEQFSHAMFTTNSSEDNKKALKPMNCPCHIQVFNQGMKSYRDLPLRLAEFGTCHRNEPSGALHGIMRVREFVQDDGHIFCTEDDITSETIKFCNLVFEVYKDFGFNDISVKFSDRPDVRAGKDEIWDKAENALIAAMNAAGLKYELNKGEGAFYGPKLEFALRDAIGREWQCGTFQVDFVMPERLNAFYINSEGVKATPVMLHRAILGSLERFIGILIEEYKGKFPLWLAPVQVILLSVTNSVDDYVEEIQTRLLNHDIRVNIDITNEKINYKIRKHSLQRIPILCIIGAQEKDNRSVMVRKSNTDQVSMEFDVFVKYMSDMSVSPLSNIKQVEGV